MPLTRRSLIAGATLAAIGAVVALRLGGAPEATAEAIVEITVPDTLPATAEAGRAVFEANCAQCHGVNAVGVIGAGPPLVHVIYEPNHHGDGSFHLAVQRGVRAHHWRFGDMPPVQGVPPGDVDRIIAYVRTLQRANGIQ